MTTPIPPDPYSAASAVAPSGASSSIIPGSALGSSAMTLNTSVLNVSSNASGGMFGYENVPQSGSLIFSFSPLGGADPYGNTFPTGVVINQGQINGVNLTGVGLDSSSTLLGSLIQSGQLGTPTIQGGTATSTLHVLNSQGGAVLSYSNAGTVLTFSTAGSYSWTAPTNVTQAFVECWGAGAGGGGGGPGQGGEAGGGGEYAAEPTLSVTPGQVYQITVGNGGSGGSTNVAGNSGSDSIFADAIGNNLVHAFPGQAGLSFQGGTGGVGSSNTVEEPGGGGGTASGNNGGSGGGSSGGQSAPGNAGAASTSNTGAAGGAAPAGGGAGGAGGNNAANGVNGSSPGGAGGGAGAGTGGGGGSVTNIYYPTASYSYYGSTASYGGGPYSRRSSNSTIYQGAASGYINLTGDQFGFALFNWHQIRSDLAGATINSVYLSLDNLHSWYNNGMNVAMGYTTYTGVFGTTFIPGGGTHEAQGVAFISEGNTYSFNVTSWLKTHIASDFTAIVLGPAASAGVSGSNLSYYGYFWGYSAGSLGNTPHLSVNFTPSGGSTELAGNGADGQVRVTYNAGNTLVGAFTPAGGTDVYGNAYAPGSTTVQHTFLSTLSNPATPASGVVTSSAPGSGQLQTTGTTGVSSTVSIARSGGGGQTVTGTSAAAISDGYTIAAADVATGTVFRLTAWGHGNTSTSGTLAALTMNIQGGNAGITLPTSAQAGSKSLNWTAEAFIRFTGATTANVHLSWTYSNGAGDFSGGEEGNTTGSSITFPYTYQLFASWGTVQTGQTISCDGTLFERLSN